MTWRNPAYLLSVLLLIAFNCYIYSVLLLWLATGTLHVPEL